MTGNNYLLDTSVVIGLFRGHRLIVEKVSRLPGIFISSVVLGELYIGIFSVVNKHKHLEKLILSMTFGSQHLLCSTD